MCLRLASSLFPIPLNLPFWKFWHFSNRNLLFTPFHLVHKPLWLVLKTNNFANPICLLMSIVKVKTFFRILTIFFILKQIFIIKPLFLKIGNQSKVIWWHYQSNHLLWWLKPQVWLGLYNSFLRSSLSKTRFSLQMNCHILSLTQTIHSLDIVLLSTGSPLCCSVVIQQFIQCLCWRWPQNVTALALTVLGVRKHLPSYWHKLPRNNNAVKSSPNTQFALNLHCNSLPWLWNNFQKLYFLFQKVPFTIGSLQTCYYILSWGRLFIKQEAVFWYFVLDFENIVFLKRDKDWIPIPVCLPIDR